MKVMVRMLLSGGTRIEDIAKATGLSEEEIMSVDG